MTVMPISTAPAAAPSAGEGPAADGDAFASLLHGQLTTGGHADGGSGDGADGQGGEGTADGDLASLLQLLAGARPLLLAGQGTDTAVDGDVALDAEVVDQLHGALDEIAALDVDLDELAALDVDLADLVQRLLDGELADGDGQPLTVDQVLTDPSLLAPALAAAGIDADQALERAVAALSRAASAAAARADAGTQATQAPQAHQHGATATTAADAEASDDADAAAIRAARAAAGDADDADADLRQVRPAADGGRTRAGGEVADTRPTATTATVDAARPAEVRRGDGSAPSAAVARVLDAIDRLEHAPPPRVVIVEHGDARLRVGLEAGTVRISLLGARTETTDQVLRETAQALQERGVEADVDGERREGWGQPGGRDADGQAPAARTDGDDGSQPAPRRGTRGLQL